MLNNTSSLFRLTIVGLVALAASASFLEAQEVDHNSMSARDAMQYRIGEQSNRIQIVVQSSRVLTFDYDVPKFVVGNNEVIRATPVAPNQLLISGAKQGVSPLGVYNADGQVQTLDIHVTGDVRALQLALDEHFPAASIRAHALNASVILTGYVPNADMMTQVMRVSEDFFPTPINNLNVGGAQTVLLNVKVVEVSRTKLRQFGVDWAAVTGDSFFVQSVNGLIDAAAAQTGNLAGTSTFRFGVMNNGDQFGAFINALEQNNMAHILDEPVLVTTSGRPASLRSGGQVPIPVQNGLGTVTVEFREFGTLLDFVPIVLGDGMLRLEINSDVVEIAGDLRDPVTGVPGFRNRGVNTGVTMRAGQTLALAGIIQNRRDAQVKGFPFLVDLPWVGTLFRSVEDTFNEVELVIMVTPQFVGAVDAEAGLMEAQTPSTVPPCDVDFYFRGYLEVPKCDSPLELGPVVPFQSGGMYDGQYENIQPRSDLEALPPMQNDNPMMQPQGGGVPFNGPQANPVNGNLPPLDSARRGNASNYPRGGHASNQLIQRTSYQPQGRVNQQALRQIPSGATANPQPRFIGQTGYDVIK